MLRPPSRETIAILDATCDELALRAPAILLAMWHHLTDQDERALLLLPVDAGGRPSSLMAATIATARSAAWRSVLATPSPASAPAPLPSRYPALGEALRRALADVFDGKLSAMVVEAWVTTLEVTLARTRAAAAGGSGGGT